MIGSPRQFLSVCRVSQMLAHRAHVREKSRMVQTDNRLIDRFPILKESRHIAWLRS